METKTKLKWAILTGFAAIAVAVVIGCDTKGGSTVSVGPGSTNKPVVVQISFGVPICSSVGQGRVDGAVFNSGAAYLYVAPTCANTNDNMYVWIEVVTDRNPAEIEYYEWTIRNWTNSAGDGVFTNFDQFIGSNGVFKVRTSLNQIRYISPNAGTLLSLAKLLTKQIDVTAMTRDGQFTSGYISLMLYNGMGTSDTLVFGDLSDLDDVNTFNRPADYFSIVGAGATNTIGLESEDFDAYLALYDTNLNLVAANDDVSPGLILDSQISAFLTNGATYYVEATSAGSVTRGSYAIGSSGGALTPVPSPFVPPGTCANIAGNYSVQQTLAINLTYNGQSYAFTNFSTTTVTIQQKGCDFWYQIQDPTGVVPPVLQMGRIAFSGMGSLELYNAAYMPQSPDFFITSSSFSGSGDTAVNLLKINSAGSVEGTLFLGSATTVGIPFGVTYASTASFTKL